MAGIDIPHLVASLGDELAACETVGSHFVFLVRKL